MRSNILLLALALTGCGGALNGKKSTTSVAEKDLVSSASGGTANTILRYSPADGTYNSVPSTVTIDFQSAALDQTAAAAVTSYSIACNNGSLYPQSVGFQAGLTSVTVSLPSITGLPDGTQCVFTVSNSLKDSFGNFVAGTHSVTWTISSTGTTPVDNVGSGSGSGTGASTGIWNEAATAVYTSAVGNPIGAYFLGIGAPGVVLTGLNVNGTQYVDGAQGLWARGFTSTSVVAGPMQGSTASTTQLACPAGMRMTGVFGKAGSYIDSIGIICKNESQTQTYTSATYGGPGGNSFTLSCPAGRFATDLGGSSNNYLDQLYLGCR